jgi:hypothetical protein
MAGQGLLWLAQRFGSQRNFCATFFRGLDERAMFAAFGADPGKAIPQTRQEAEDAEASWDQGYGPFMRVGRCGRWLFAWEQMSWEGMRPEVLRRVSAGGDAVAVRNSLSGIAGFAYAERGDVVTSLVTIRPYTRDGSDPDRFLSLLRRVGLAEAAQPGGPVMSALQAVLTVAEEAFGLSLEETELERVLPSARVLPVLEDLSKRPRPRTEVGQQVPRIGDPVVDLLLAHTDERSLRAAVAGQVRGVLADSGLDEFGELTEVVESALAGLGRPISDDDPAGLVLRQIGREKYEAEVDGFSPQPHLTATEQRRRMRRDNAAWVIHAVLAWGPEPALAAAVNYRGRWGSEGWREQFLADLARIKVPPAELQHAKQRWQALQQNDGHSGPPPVP